MDLQQSLRDLVASLIHKEKLLDSQFAQLQELDDETNPGFVAEVIGLFHQDTDRILMELSKLMNMQVVDYAKVAAYVHQLKGSSSSIGAQCIKYHCINFRQVAENRDKDGCIRILNTITNEYRKLESRFKIYLELDHQIRSYGSKQQ